MVRYTKERKEYIKKIVVRYENGESRASLAKECNVTYKCVHSWTKDIRFMNQKKYRKLINTNEIERKKQIEQLEVRLEILKNAIYI